MGVSAGYSPRVTGEGTIELNEALRAHIFEGRQLGDEKRDMSELDHEEEAAGVAEHVLWSADTDAGEERERLGIAILVHGVVGHVHVVLANDWSLDTTEVDCLCLRVLLDVLDEREAVDGEQMSVGRVPDHAGGRGGSVQIPAPIPGFWEP